jgi:hypothetical protein
VAAAEVLDHHQRDSPVLTTGSPLMAIQCAWSWRSGYLGWVAWAMSADTQIEPAMARARLTDVARLLVATDYLIDIAGWYYDDELTTSDFLTSVVRAPRPGSAPSSPSARWTYSRVGSRPVRSFPAAGPDAPAPA